MQSGQRVARLRVIEFLYVDLLPVFIVMALQAVLAEPAFVMILVAVGTRRRDAEITSVEIFILDRLLLLRGDSRRVVALVASHSDVLALEDVSRVFMVEGLDVPFNQRKIFAIVFRVAARALLA